MEEFRYRLLMTFLEIGVCVSPKVEQEASDSQFFECEEAPD